MRRIEDAPAPRRLSTRKEKKKKKGEKRGSCSRLLFGKEGKDCYSPGGSDVLPTVPENEGGKRGGKRGGETHNCSSSCARGGGKKGIGAGGRSLSTEKKEGGKGTGLRPWSSIPQGGGERVMPAASTAIR